jgi:hypothetical protein
MPPTGPIGPASVHSSNPGLAAKSLAQVGEAIRILELALPNVPPGTPVHKDVLDSISKLAKHVPAGSQVNGVQMTELADLQRSASQNAMLQAVMRQSAQPGGPGGPGGAGAPPAIPQPGGPPGGMPPGMAA